MIGPINQSVASNLISISRSSRQIMTETMTAAGRENTQRQRELAAQQLENEQGIRMAQSAILSLSFDMYA